ncbi:MAG: MMPL family transporter [Pirellulales bacterium]|nr:MMPL family transporter [Pirellulales bacterium]
MMESLVGRAVEFAIRWRTWLLAVGAVLLALAWIPSRQLSFDRSIESMFAKDNPLLPPYEQLKRTFGGNEIALAAYRDPALLTNEGIKRLEKLTERLRQVSGVRAVISLTQTPFGTGIIEESSLNEQLLTLFEGFTISEDRQTAGLVCILTPRAPSEERNATVEELRAMMRNHQPAGVLTGEPVMVVEGFRLIEEDGDRLGWVSTLLLMGTIIFCFRSVRWVIAPLVIVNATLIFTKAALVLLRFQLSMVSSMLWAIVTVVGIATVIHVIVRYREESEFEQSAFACLRSVGLALTIPVIWTCLTDAAGFGSLLAANVGPVADFGVMMSAGSLVALLSLALLLPGLALNTPLPATPKRAWGEDWLDRGLERAMDLALTRPRSIALLALILIVGAIWGCLRISVETDFTKNFRQTSELVRSYEFVEQGLGGAGVWDILVPAPPPDDLSAEFLAKLSALGDRLRNEVAATDAGGNNARGLTKVMSMADVIDPFVGQAKASLPAFLPVDDAALTSAAIATFRGSMPDAYRSFYGQDSAIPGRHFARIMLRAKERQPANAKRELIEQVTQISEEEFPATQSMPAARVTGFFVLLASLIESMVRDQWMTFGIASAAILGMMLIAFRRPLVAVAAVIPNIMPILLVTGALGWLGIKINMGAAMIAAVSVGLSVDSSIHYVSDFLRRKQRGQDVAAALHGVQQTVGRAVTFSTLALIVGFAVLCLSDFVPTIYFGVLVGLSMLGGLIGNVGLLPILLRSAVEAEGRVVARYRRKQNGRMLD